MHPNPLPRDETTGLVMTDAPHPPMLQTGTDSCLGRIGALEVHLATSACEVEAAQRLRYKVFYQERSAGAPCDLGHSTAKDSVHPDHDTIAGLKKIHQARLHSGTARRR